MILFRYSESLCKVHALWSIDLYRFSITVSKDEYFKLWKTQIYFQLFFVHEAFEVKKDLQTLELGQLIEIFSTNTIHRELAGQTS